MVAKKKDDTEDSSKIFDVSKPGDSAPSATTRPIIVNRSGSIVQDPMVKADQKEKPEESEEETTEKPETAPTITQTHEKIIEPSAEMVSEAEKTKENTKSEDEESKANDEVGSDMSDSESGAVDALANEVKTKGQEQKKSEEEAKKEAELQKIIDSKKYFVPIKESATSSGGLGRIILFTVVIIVILAIAFNFALDSGSIDIGIEPLTDLL